MATTQKKLAASALSATLTTYYTAPASTRTAINAVTLCNTGASARAVTLKVAGRAVLSARPLAVNETLALSLALVLESGDTLQAQQDAGTDVDLLVSGSEIA